MTLVRIATVVEGQGEVAAMPVLLRRLAQQIDPQLYVDSPRPHRVPRGTLLRAGGVETARTTSVRSSPQLPRHRGRRESSVAPQ